MTSPEMQKFGEDRIETGVEGQPLAPMSGAPNMDASYKKFDQSMEGMNQIGELTDQGLSDDRKEEMQVEGLNEKNPSINIFVENLPDNVELEDLKKDPYLMQQCTNESYDDWKKNMMEKGVSDPNNLTKESYISALKAGGLEVEKNLPVLDDRKKIMAKNYETGMLNEAQLNNMVKTNQITEQEARDIKTYAEYRRNMLPEQTATPPPVPTQPPVYVAENYTQLPQSYPENYNNQPSSGGAGNIEGGYTYNQETGELIPPGGKKPVTELDQAQFNADLQGDVIKYATED